MSESESRSRVLHFDSLHMQGVLLKLSGAKIKHSKEGDVADIDKNVLQHCARFEQSCTYRSIYKVCC